MGGVGDEAAYTEHDRNTTETQSSAEICWYFQGTLFHLNMLGDGYCDEHLNDNKKNVSVCHAHGYEHKLFTTHGKIQTHVNRENCITQNT